TPCISGRIGGIFGAPKAGIASEMSAATRCILTNYKLFAMETEAAGARGAANPGCSRFSGGLFARERIMVLQQPDLFRCSTAEPPKRRLQPGLAAPHPAPPQVRSLAAARSGNSARPPLRW